MNEIVRLPPRRLSPSPHDARTSWLGRGGGERLVLAGLLLGGLWAAVGWSLAL